MKLKELKCYFFSVRQVSISVLEIYILGKIWGMYLQIVSGFDQEEVIKAICYV